MRNGVAVCRRVLLLSGFILPLLPLQAQLSPPKRHDARSATGVSFRSGSFTIEETDLSIGDDATGLKLVRSYSSSSDGLSDPYVAAVGWTHNFNIYVSIQPLPQVPETMQPPNYYGRCVYNVVGGAGAVGFVYTGANPPQSTSCGGIRVGTYQPITPAGSRLEVITTPSNRYRYTGADGSVLNFSGGVTGKALDWTKPDGSRQDFTYSNGTSGSLKLVSNNRGWAILFESATKICAVNLAQTYVTSASTCPAGAQAVTYTYTPGTYASSWQLMRSATRSGSSPRYYDYASNDHVSCIRDPGQSVCRIQNSYSHCPEDPYVSYPIQTSVRMHDQVLSQTDGSGRSYTYSYSQDECPKWSIDTDPDWRPFEATTTTMTETGVPGSTVVVTDSASQVVGFTDPLGRSSQFAYDGSSYWFYETGDLSYSKQPEGNSITVGKDARGNITSLTTAAKPSSGQASLFQSAVYPSTCSTLITCNKPTSVTDARGATTDFTYDTTHGGLLTETGPADAGGVRPVKRSAYAQRSAWLKNSSGGYSASPYPIWLLSETRTCRTTATVGNGCAGGTGDEIVTVYDYGPNSGPNNLLLRGIAVTADGQTRRTCYGYDGEGQKISETSPMAGLTSCP